MPNLEKCVDCGRERTLSYDTKQCHECEQVERERELDAIDEAIAFGERDLSCSTEDYAYDPFYIGAGWGRK